MKKNLIALAILGAFSGAALAQSNVTLYGIVDVGYQLNDPEVGGPTNTSGIVSGHQSGSRFGVRGVEVLSSNLNAVFTLEAGYGVDTGTSLQGGRLFGRQAWGGLSGGWGTLVAGRVATFSSGTGSFDMFGQVDPFGTGWGDASLGSTFSSGGALRLDNAVLYQTPTWGGFRFGAGYSFSGNGGEFAGSGNNLRVGFLGASWGAGPFYAVVTYDVATPAPLAGSATTPRIEAGASDQKMLQAGLTFDFKIVKLHAAYAKEDRAWFTAGLGVNPDAGADADAWMAGVTVRLFGGELLGSYQTRDGDAVGVCLSASLAPACPIPLVTRERDIDEYAVGYSYPLSRRTNIYISYSDRDAEGTSNNDVTLDRKQYSLGIRHLF
jgi:general bacterial porin, GBP family